ncbi:MULTISPECIES: hypothetical protein [unclassified Agarivorans]|uniref:hypothetical protein n=1 Tax=unclassified Agarivorans TaxID=2636026 RepID=UPI003D7E66DE
MKPYVAYQQLRVELPQTTAKPEQAAYIVAHVTAVIHDEAGRAVKYQLDHDVEVVLAMSSLIQPVRGDLVAYLKTEAGCFLLHILQRNCEQVTQINSVHPIQLHAPKIVLSAEQELELLSLNRFSLTGQHGLISVSGTLVSCADFMVKQVNQLMVTAKGLLRLSGRQQVITAEEDVRIDGKRINMG